LFEEIKTHVSLKNEYATMLNNLQESVLILKDNVIHYANKTFLAHFSSTLESLEEGEKMIDQPIFK
jgi:nitrogen-specific signal transduction histidine kinase